MPRKRRSTKSRIVKAAWNLFYKNGYEQTTVEDIINASKTSKGTFYHYFKGKEALLNSLSYLFDQKYEDLAAVIDPNLSCYDKLLFLNHELFYMIETSIDIHLLAYLYSSQLVTKDKKSLSDKKRIYFKWLTEIMEEGLKNGEFKNTSTASELMEIYAMYERALLYDWGPFQRQILTDRTYRQVTSTCITDICGWTLIAMYSKEAASFPYIKKLTGVDRRDFSAVNACSLSVQIFHTLVMTSYTRHS